MKLLGTILLWAGFLAGALTTVMNPPQKAVKNVKALSQAEKVRKATDEKVRASGDAEAIAELPPAPRYDIADLSEVELPEDGWHQIPWVYYGISAGVCFIGVVLIQVQRQSKQVQSESNLASIGQLVVALENAAVGIQSVHKDLESVPPSHTVAAIDDQIVPHLINFADNRDAISNEFGLSVFADVMTDFAAGERAVNRCWSASADGYLDESDTCLKRASEMIQSALTKLKQQIS